MHAGKIIVISEQSPAWLVVAAVVVCSVQIIIPSQLIIDFPEITQNPHRGEEEEAAGRPVKINQNLFVNGGGWEIETEPRTHSYSQSQQWVSESKCTKIRFPITWKLNYYSRNVETIVLKM